MITLRANRSAFQDYRLLPKILVDVKQPNLKTTVLGSEVDMPICIAPTAIQRLAHPLGEIATARAAAKFRTLMTLSSVSTTSLEEVASSTIPGAPRWFQLYIYKDRSITLKLIQRAEAAGYRAIVLTVDTPILGRREADLRNLFALPPHLKLGNFEGGLGSQPVGVKQQGSALNSYFAQQIDDQLTWTSTIPFIRENVGPDMKIIVKGVLTAEDALIACDLGVDAIWVSNHGARQLDTVPATTEVLEEITTACANHHRDVEIYVDGGFTRGTDVLVALALGARAVFIGRPVIWGLSHDGEQGVVQVLQLLKDELSLAMKLSGVTDVNKVPKGIVSKLGRFDLCYN